MNKFLLFGLLLISGLAYGASANDFRISDNSGNVLNINSNGSLPVAITGNVGLGTTTFNNVANFATEFSYTSNIGLGTTTINWNNGVGQNIGIGTSQGAYIAFTHPSNSNYASLNLRIKQDATGSRVVSFWPATVLWAGGTAPTLTTTANKSDIISCKWNGTNDYCVVSQNF